MPVGRDRDRLVVHAGRHQHEVAGLGAIDARLDRLRVGGDADRAARRGDLRRGRVARTDRRDVGRADVVTDGERRVLALAGRAVQRAVVRELPGVLEAERVRLPGREVPAAERVPEFGVTLCRLRPSLTQRTVVPGFTARRDGRNTLSRTCTVTTVATGWDSRRRGTSRRARAPVRASVSAATIAAPRDFTDACRLHALRRAFASRLRVAGFARRPCACRRLRRRLARRLEVRPTRAACARRSRCRPSGGSRRRCREERGTRRCRGAPTARRRRTPGGTARRERAALTGRPDVLHVGDRRVDAAAVVGGERQRPHALTGAVGRGLHLRASSRRRCP